MNTFSLDMDFDELKKQWDDIVVETRSHEDLKKITHVQSPRLVRLREKLILDIAISFLVVVAVIVVTQLRTVSPWLTSGFILCNAFYLFNNVLGFHYLSTLPEGVTIRDTITGFHTQMKKMLTLSNVAGCAMILFVLGVDFFLLDSAEERFTFSMFLAPLTGLSFWAADKWRSRMTEVREILIQFESGDRDSVTSGQWSVDSQ